MKPIDIAEMGSWHERSGVDSRKALEGKFLKFLNRRFGPSQPARLGLGPETPFSPD